MKPAVISVMIRVAGVLAVVLVPACEKSLVRVAEPVGPAPIQAPSPRIGRLLVSTEELPSDADLAGITRYQPYTLYDTSGRAVKEVSNDSGEDIVELEEGRYSVRVQSSRRRVIAVDVQIVGGATTEVHLDGKWMPTAPGPKTALVVGPDGAPIGYRVAPTPIASASTPPRWSMH